MYAFLRLCLVAITSCVLLTATAQNDSSVFGSKNFLPDGLWGKIYALPDTTTRLPGFDTLEALGSVYSKEINIPTRNWEEGFPGATDRVEWFGIDYKSSFKTKKQGLYRFRLLSDDGSRLFIDEKLVIDHDGLHQASSKEGELQLDGSEHSIRLQYFQGPRAQIALQLFVSYRSEGEEVFPGSHFTLTTPTEEKGSKLLMWGVIIIAALLLFLFFRKKKKKPSASTPDGSHARI